MDCVVDDAPVRGCIRWGHWPTRNGPQKSDVEEENETPRTVLRVAPPLDSRDCSPGRARVKATDLHVSLSAPDGVATATFSAAGPRRHAAVAFQVSPAS